MAHTLSCQETATDCVFFTATRLHLNFPPRLRPELVLYIAFCQPGSNFVALFGVLLLFSVPPSLFSSAHKIVRPYSALAVLDFELGPPRKLEP